MARLRIGTCSWKYDSWRGLVYSRDDKINYLSEYSGKYNTVEIDQWFWSLHEGRKPSLPQRAVAESYAASVDENFRFSVKVPNSITLTHYYQKNKNEPLEPNAYFLSKELFSEFLSSISPLKDNLGPIMFQFEYLNKQKMPSQSNFLNSLGEFFQNIPMGYHYAVETRNPNYLNTAFFDFLEKHGLGFVFLQGYYMPQITDLYSNLRIAIKNYVIIRLHGPDRKGMEEKSAGDWSRIIEPKDDEIERIVEIIADLLSRDIDIYLNVNNHYEGSAPLTIEKVQKYLQP